MNESLGWLSIGIGLVAGAWLGLNYDKADWLGGYGSLRRRLIRLGHIAMIALGFLNILFAHSQARIQLSGTTMTVASWLLIVGCFSMPLSCFLNAWRTSLKPLFGVPVVTLVSGCALVAWGLMP